MKKLHLTDQKGQVRAVISLRCANCKEVHPDSPNALAWWQLELRKGKLKCPRCGSRNFTRTNSQTPQGELIADIIAKKSKHLRRHIEDEVGDENEGRKYEKKYGIKYV